ncbi:hypothetical protein U1Q18_044824 [Sarracenia purpurea var. burkii]
MTLTISWRVDGIKQPRHTVGGQEYLRRLYLRIYCEHLSDFWHALVLSRSELRSKPHCATHSKSMFPRLCLCRSPCSQTTTNLAASSFRQQGVQGRGLRAKPPMPGTPSLVSSKSLKAQDEGISSKNAPAPIEGKNQAASPDVPAKDESPLPPRPKETEPLHPNNIFNDQAFLTVDTAFSAAAPLYLQSVVKKQQRIEQENRAAFNQAAERKASERKEISRITAHANDGWPPGYFAMIEHLGAHNGVFRFLNSKFSEHLRSLVNPRKAEKRHVLEAGRRACEDLNDVLSGEWETFLSAETVKSPYWDAECKAVWKDNMDKLARIAQSQRPSGKVCMEKALLSKNARA